jgi:hypothetical protein
MAGGEARENVKKAAGTGQEEGLVRRIDRPGGRNGQE